MIKQALPLIPLRGRVNLLSDSMSAMQAYIEKRLFELKTLKSEEIKKAKREVLERIEKQRAFNFAWVAANVPAAYLESQERITRRLRTLNLTPGKSRDRKAEIKRKSTDELLNRFDNAINDIKARANEFFKLLTQANNALLQNLSSFGPAIREGIKKIKLFSITLRPFTEGGVTLLGTPERKIVQEAIKELFKETFGDFNFIEVTLKNGGTRKYKPDYYFKMVARTEMRFTQTEATINLCEQWGCDLVQVSRHEDPCELCAEYEGKVYSISGNDPEFPALDIDMPLHPNCEHNLDPVTRAGLREKAAA